MATTVDYPLYITPPRIGSASGVVLVRRLINTAPKNLKAKEKAALERVREGGLRVQEIGKARDRARPESLKDEDRAFDAAWGVLRDQVAAWLRAEGTREHTIATRIMAHLFPRGIDFVALSTDAQWVESAKRLERIKEEKLDEDIAKLVHPSVLPQVRVAHRALGEALGVGETPVAPPEEDGLRDALQDLGTRTAAYARALMASVDDDDEKSVRRFLHALAPIAHHRAKHGNASGPANAVDPEPVDPASGGPTDPAGDDPTVDAPTDDDPNAPLPPIE